MNLTGSYSVFTAAQYAAALGMNRQSIQHALRLTPPSRRVLAHGNLADAWILAALPIALQTALDAAAAQRGVRNPLALLSEPPAPWQPRLPIAQAGQDPINRAAMLRTVLEPFLRGKDSRNQTSAEFEAAGVSAYAHVFGHPISGRWFRALFKRTLDRDNGAADFHRLEIYLDDNIAAALRSPRPAGKKYDHSALAYRLAFQDAAKPTLTERQNAMEYSFRHFEEMAADAPPERAEIKQSILRFLYESAPGLARTVKALKRNWNRLYARWKKEQADTRRHRRWPRAQAERFTPGGVGRRSCFDRG